MSYEIQPDAARRLVDVTVVGTYDAKSVVEMVATARELAEARGWHILYDMRSARPGDMSSADLYWMPRRLPALGSDAAARIRVAVVHPAEHAALAAYWETTFLNSGLQVKAFAEEPVALEWLRA